MKVAILAGGVGSRISEETEIRPKPMVEIGGRPILWHIMEIYASHGLKDFVVALGYKGEYIKRYMVEYLNLTSDLKIKLGEAKVETVGDSTPPEDWNIELIDTGQGTATGGRIKRLKPYLGDEPFCLTWGDGVSNVDIPKLIEFHKSHGKLCTVTAVRPPARFGLIELNGDRVDSFSEKPQLGEGWINGAFFVCEPGVMDYVDGDDTMWERAPMEGLARDGQLMAYKHEGFWQCMDTLRDKKLLEDLWESGNAPWKNWK